MWIRVKKLARRLLVGGAIIVIALAIAVGAMRIALTQLPGYQTEFRAWIAAELGVTMEFGRLDARWGLRGPELTFYEASVANVNQAEPFLSARSASVSFDVLKFVLERELTVKAITFDATRLTLLRTEEGEFRIAGAASGIEFGTEFLAGIPSQIAIAVRDGQLRYVDEALQEAWQFVDVAANLIQQPDRLAIELRARPPDRLGERIELSLEAELADDAEFPGQWRVFGNLRQTNLAAFAHLLSAPNTPSIDGSGDISIWIDWMDGKVSRGMTSVALDNVALLELPSDANGIYERIALTLEWSQDAERSWQLALSDVDLSRNGNHWPSGGNSTLQLSRDDGDVQGLSIRTDFLRLEDLTPIVLSLPDSAMARQWRALNPRGDLEGVEFSLNRTADEWDYSIAGEFSRLGWEPISPWPGVDNLAAVVRSDARTGRVQFRSRDVRFNWPDLFRQAIEADNLNGLVVWRQGRNSVRIVSDDLALSALDADIRSDLELTIPLDGSSPRLDLVASATEFDIVAAKSYLPAKRMPPRVVKWLDSAIQNGLASNLRLSFFGPLASFPFDADDGQFRITADVDNVDLEYLEGWPSAEDLDGTLDFLNAGFRATGTGRVLSDTSSTVDVGIEDMRAAVLALDVDSNGPLTDVVAFLRTAPLIAQHLGRGYDRLNAHGGNSEVDLVLQLPLLNFSAYELYAGLNILNGELSVEGLSPQATEINGLLNIHNSTVEAEGMEAIFLDGPLTARVVRSELPGYRAKLEVEGEITADAVLEAFDLPFRDLLAGQTRWQGALQIPELSEDGSQPVTITVSSNLTGAALKFPPPFDKPPAEPVNLQIEFSYPQIDQLQVEGNLGATKRFALNYLANANGYELDRGTLSFGGNRPELPDAGVTVNGSLPVLNLSDWLGLSETLGLERVQPLFVGGTLELNEFSIFGQQLGSSRVNARRDSTAWYVDIDSEPIAGSLTIPTEMTQRPQVIANMQRLYLSNSDGVNLGAVDPRVLPGFTVSTEEFGIGKRRLGHVDAVVMPEPLGLRLVSFASASDSLSAEGTGSWLESRSGVATRVAVSINSNDVAGALQELGFDPVIEGEVADLTASVYWAGPPTADWIQHVNGDVAVRVEKGSMLDIEPGASRVVGLMSILAIPRRLALDFRDVFNKGFGFDEITGDFNLIDGNAFTDNLMLTGPGAEIGVVGRTGLRDRDYEQQAIVTAEPGNMLPVVGALVAGAGVGAALLIFTRIFKKPLKGIGQAAYCIRGSWDEPAVERLSNEQLEQNELCAALPPTVPAVADSQNR